MNQYHEYPYLFLQFRQKNITFFSTLLLFFICGLALEHQSDGVIVTLSDFRALQALKHEFIDFRGGLSSWNDSGHGVCSSVWAGIRCSKGHIIAIQLPFKNLGGRISEKIGELKALQRLSLHTNGLSGPVPYSLGSLPNLRFIYLFNNRLSGTIPPSIANNHNLQGIDLSNNQLTGEIPSNLFTSNKLFRLNLSFNSISGSIPKSLTRSLSLTILDLQYNNLSSSIPDAWGEGEKEKKIYELRIFSLDHNNLSGRIPSSLSELNSLEMLTLSKNKIDGPIPDELGTLLGLKTLDLSDNNINGTLPASFLNLTSLVSLNLGGNHLNSEILESIDRLHNLSVLNLRKNHFSGEVLATIGNISTLTQLDLSNNNFSGKIPTSLANLINLTTFNVSYNNLSGNVPSVLSEKFNSSAFIGNIQLCGYSTSTPCPSPSPQNLPSPSESLKNRKVTAKDLILIPAGAILVLLLIMCSVILCCLIKKRAAKKSKKAQKATLTEKSIPIEGAEIESGGEAGGKLVHFDGPFVFTADDLLCATAEIMGKSSYGTVYKATLEDNNQVAVKRLREKVTKAQKEFETEVVSLGKIRNQNILALRAYYLGPKGEKLLVFDYMPNGSLSSFLHARGPETSVTWPTRLKIATGITRGLCYLHTQVNMAHGNLTASNIVLDEQMEPKIGDVGLSRLMTSAANTNMVATAGTLGYRAPELSKLKNATTKTDIYSLGVIVLELLTGKSPSEATDGADLPQWVASIVKEEWTNEVFDVELIRDNNNNESNTGDELLNTLKLALHCVDPSPIARPEAQQVLQQLEEISSKPEEIVAGSAHDGAKDTPPS